MPEHRRQFVGTPELARSSPVAINAASSFARLLNTAAEESNSDINNSTSQLQVSSANLAYFFISTAFGQSLEKIFQRLNLNRRSRILSCVFVDYFIKMFLENAFGG